MVKMLLDSNIYDLLAKDTRTCNLLQKACASSKVKVIASPVVRIELEDSPFGGIPDFFPVELVVDRVAIPGLAIPGLVTPGSGTIFSDHIGESKQTKDAVIADAAHTYANIFVSEDRRARTRLRELSGVCIALDYKEFQVWIEGVK